MEVVEDSDDDEEEDSVYSESSEETETDTDSEFKVAKPTIPKSQKKGFKLIVSSLHNLNCFFM